MQFLSKAHITHIHPHLNKDKLFKCLTARLKSTHPSLQRAAAAMAAAAPGPAPAPPTLRDVLFSLEDLEIKPWAAKCLLAGMHLLENAQASLAQRPPAADETIDQQNGCVECISKLHACWRQGRTMLTCRICALEKQCTMGAMSPASACASHHAAGCCSSGSRACTARSTAARP